MWAPQYKAYNFAFADDVAFTKGTTDDKFFYDISDLYTRKFFDYNGFSISPSIGPFDPNYVYAAMRQLISSISYITYIVPGFCTVPDLLCYWINGIYVRNCPVDVNKPRKLFIFNPENIFMKNIKATTQIGGFNQSLPILQSNKRFLCSGRQRHKDDAIENFLLSVPAHDGTTSVELIARTKTLLAYGRVPAQDGLFALIIWYVAKTLYWS